ncbi:MAG: zinc-binding alcohol dehydrogenase family protein [Cyanobacteria bacterium]|nr:zinc-binding alcohol dehydrogenase family protein [Cyanobacteriota bacterium]
MKAIAAYGGLPSRDPAAFAVVDLPDPVPSPHDLLVRVEAVAVNPVDTKVRSGLPGPGAGAPPRLLGWDAAGVVEATGDAVERFVPGDRVWFAGDISRPGCNAERVLVEEAICGHRPANLSAAEAAALPLTGLTAWEALFERLGLDPEGADAGRSLLILGGAGGVGSMAIQLARRAGLVVIATASRPESRAWCERLGASHVVDHSQPLAPQLAALGLPEVDTIANFSDTDAYWPVMAELIRPQGAIVAIVGNRAPLDLNLLKAKSVSFHWEFMFTRPQFHTPDRGRQGEILERLAQLVEAGEIQSTAATRLEPISPENLARAHALLEGGRTLGKIVLAGWEGVGGPAAAHAAELMANPT